jgi:biotin transport system substrate-specific component
MTMDFRGAARVHTAPRVWWILPAAATAAAGMTALGAQIAMPLPWTPVPVTLQVFCVLVAAGLLGARPAMLGQAQYLAVGLVGAPVFAGFRAGPAVLLGPTGGYLIGFLPAALLVGWACSRGGFWRILAGCALGAAVIHTTGVMWLHLGMGQPWGTAIMLGSVPFLAVEAVKVILAASVISAIRSR